MIRYSLRCDKAHAFDSWFASASAFDRLAAAGQVACPVCGATTVEKALMAPAVASTEAAAAPAPRPRLDQPDTPLEAAMAELRRQIEANSDYVGMNFAAEARAIHEGEAPARAIYGETRPEEARKLIEDGVPVAPLPFLPGRKAN